MNRKPSFLIAFMLFLVSLSPATLKVQKAEASGTIYIRADGSIEGTANIQTADAVTYVFSANISDSIIVERDSVVIDGAGYTLQGSGAWDSRGIDLSGRTNVTVRNTEIKNFSYGIWLDGSSNNSINGNNIGDNNWGIELSYSSSNSINGNNITASEWDGIRLAFCSNNSIVGNDITNNWCGILSLASPENKIYHNNFINNTLQTFTSGGTSVWDDGYPSGGNYWSDYNGTDLFSGRDQNETGRDAIGDTEYLGEYMEGNNTDNYPLMGMSHSIDITFLPGSTVTLISNSTISYFHVVTFIRETVETSKDIHTIFINFTDQDGYGFCRVSIPHALMNISNTPVTIDYGFTTVLNPNYMLYDNGTQRWIYFAYEQSPSPLNQTSRFPARIMIIPEFQSFLILPLFFTITLLIAIVCRRKHVQRQWINRSLWQDINWGRG